MALSVAPALSPGMANTTSAPPILSLSLEKLLDQAIVSGELRLNGRNLKSFPRRHSKAARSALDLVDTVTADLSRNKLNEVPEECIQFSSMEKFLLYHNTIKSIPDSIIQLQSLQFLDLSRNQLSYLPANLCSLPLQGLIVNNNRLVSLPEEIGKMQTLMELDASCNEIAHLPVQIGDLSSLKCLKLRRNHLQEIPVEISYLQLSTLDLSGNRISVLPVELRFMTTVIDLNLEENPLTCPPANLCSRGRIHIYKYLEIQAIKEDRRRGVLTDTEYRRSYRKTGSTQLSDLGFNNMFHCDPRRKRNTADSGYGSEQPLERRWSQDFNQENQDFHHHPHHPEEGKRIILKAAVASSHKNTHSTLSRAPLAKATTPLQAASSGSSSSTSSGYNSLSGHSAASLQIHSWEGENNELPLKQPTPSHPNPKYKMSDGHINDKSSKSNGRDFVDHSPTSQENNKPDLSYNQNSSGNPSSREGAEATPSSSQYPLLLPPPPPPTQPPRHPQPPQYPSSNSSRYLPPPSTSKLPSPRQHPSYTAEGSNKALLYSTCGSSNNNSNSSSSSTSNSSSNGCSVISGTHRISGLGSPPARSVGGSSNGGNSSGLPLPSKTNPRPNPESQTKIHSQSYRQYKEQLRQQRISELKNGSFYDSPSNEDRPSMKATNGSNNLSYSYDVKTMQKEAVLSFVKSKAANRSSESIVGSGIPQPSLLGSRGHRMHSNGGDQTRSFAARREAEKSASSEVHIQQLKSHLENRLRLTLPDDIAGSLVDGVILCHMANHVKPRSVPSIHVPSPAVPKLTSAKCRKNVENFLLACRKIGVRDDLICSPSDVLEPRKHGTVRIAISVSELLRFSQPKLIPN
eukprot:TRINITY_DN1879_c0_g1_i2.p1 TRINITY_DN1879_c0_g1~~TRINITY_DN1879_c0_g1_i2.p1  ORF type:complete len:855 (+),score=187.66 TRINITY_DN1879_c0_g1_i2:95-2659(+)